MIPVLFRTFRLLGLKYLPLLPIDVNFIEAKNFFIRLLKKLSGKKVSPSLVELRLARSTTRTGLSVRAYFSIPTWASILTAVSLLLFLVDWQP